MDIPHHRAHGQLRETVLTILGLLGIVAIAWFSVSWIFGLSVIVVSTGSMGAGIPAGSAAIVERVAAADLVTGDVVALARADGGPPLVRRVVDVAPADAAWARVLTLRGEADDRRDEPTAEVVRTSRVVAAAPAIGPIVPRHRCRWYGER